MTVIHPPTTVEETATELHGLADAVIDERVDPDFAQGLALRHWVSMFLPNPAQTWQDYVEAVREHAGLAVGLVTWQDIVPGLTCCDRHDAAREIAAERVDELLALLLNGPRS